MTVDFISSVDVATSLDNRVSADATTERTAFATVVVEMKHALAPASASLRLSHERLHEIDRAFFGPFFREKYGRGGDRALENDRIRYYGLIEPANDGGELAGRRYVHEFDTMTGCTRGWHETVDRAGNVRQVRPERNDGTTRHYQFDSNRRYRGRW
ncbi:MAG: hypothetical protein WBF73_20570 [Bradyrhizobium sp.]|jgi:hypothetical protein